MADPARLAAERGASARSARRHPRAARSRGTYTGRTRPSSSTACPWRSGGAARSGPDAGHRARPSPAARLGWAAAVVVSRSRPPAGSHADRRRPRRGAGGPRVGGRQGHGRRAGRRGRLSAQRRPVRVGLAAPVAVAAAAGLHVLCLDGSPLVYNRPDPYLPDLLVCRPDLADRAIAAARRRSSLIVLGGGVSACSEPRGGGFHDRREDVSPGCAVLDLRCCPIAMRRSPSHGGLFGWTFENAMPPDAPGYYLIARLGGRMSPGRATLK